MQEKISFSLSEHTEDSLKLNFMENHSVTMNAVPYILYREPVDIKNLKLQESEVEEVNLDGF